MVNDKDDCQHVEERFRQLMFYIGHAGNLTSKNVLTENGKPLVDRVLGCIKPDEFENLVEENANLPDDTPGLTYWRRHYNRRYTRAVEFMRDTYFS